MGKIQDLIQSIKDDAKDRAEWEERARTLQDHRLSKRMRNTRYRNAPNFVDPIIDDNIRDGVSQEMSMMFSTRQLANFHGLTSEAVAKKRDAETGFDSMLRMLLGWRRKIENALDNKRAIGFAILKQTENNTSYEKYFDIPGDVIDPVVDAAGQPVLDGEGNPKVTVIQTRKTLPDMAVVSPFDFIVPTNTEELGDAERCCQVFRYSKRKFKALGKAQSWENVEEIVKKYAGADDQEGDDTRTHSEGVGKELKISGEDTEVNIDEIVVWEIYHYSDAGEKMRTLVVPAWPDMPLQSLPWAWATTSKERDWPYVQLRNENRELGFYDTRGDAELLLDNQKASTAYMNGKASFMDFFCFPMFTGPKKATQSKNPGPGSFLADGVKPVTMPQPGAFFDHGADSERAKAARRTGASEGGFSKKGGGDKTATQVNAESINASRQTNVSATRDGDPMSEFYMMMWTWLQHNPIPLPMFVHGDIRGDGMMETSVYDLQFIVQAASNSQNSNPDFVLQQMMALGPILQASPMVRQDELMRILVDQLNPQLTEKLVVDPESAGPQGQPTINQQITQIGQGMEQIQEVIGQIVEAIKEQGTQIEALNKFASETSEDELRAVAEEEERKRGGQLEVA